MGVEIERKFTVRELPQNLDQFPVNIIEQGYLSVVPAIRVRRENNNFYMTYKSHKGFGGAAVSSESGDIGKIEYNLPLDKDSYEHLVAKADGNVISKKRYIIPINKDAFDSSDDKLQKVMDSLKIELDVFEGKFEGRILAEVEFPDEETAAAYRPADWFLEDVTGDVRYSNAHMSTE